MSVVNMYVMDNFVDLVQSGLVSVHGFIRALACQIFNNNIEVLVN